MQTELENNTPSLVETEVSAVAASAREQHEIQAAFTIAKKFPRDENVAFAKIMKSMDRPLLAESSTYSFPRGGQAISGPSVDLAREAARCWGNLRYGFRVLSSSDDQVRIVGYGLDLETNARNEMEDSFKPLVQRKRNGVTQWVKPDERDMRELLNRRGAILERNCILKMMPPDVIEEAMAKAKKTLAAQMQGKLKENRDDLIRGIVMAFSSLGVTVEMLEAKLGHPLSAVIEAELVELRGIYKSISDGVSRPSEYFDFGQPKATSDEGATKLNEILSDKTKPAKKATTMKTADQIEQEMRDEEIAQLKLQAQAGEL